LIAGKLPDEVRALIIGRFGPPAHTFGSGVRIETWDVGGGVLIFHPASGPSFDEGGQRVWLMRTNNPAGLCLYGHYEMAIKPEPPSRMAYNLGDLYMTWDSSYIFTVSRGSSEHRQGQAKRTASSKAERRGLSRFAGVGFRLEEGSARCGGNRGVRIASPTGLCVPSGDMRWLRSLAGCSSLAGVPAVIPGSSSCGGWCANWRRV
jgi:hypothetical protein